MATGKDGIPSEVQKKGGQVSDSLGGQLRQELEQELASMEAGKGRSRLQQDQGLDGVEAVCQNY